LQLNIASGSSSPKNDLERNWRNPFCFSVKAQYEDVFAFSVAGKQLPTSSPRQGHQGRVSKSLSLPERESNRQSRLDKHASL